MNFLLGCLGGHCTSAVTSRLNQELYQVREDVLELQQTVNVEVCDPPLLVIHTNAAHTTGNKIMVLIYRGI